MRSIAEKCSYQITLWGMVFALNGLAQPATNVTAVPSASPLVWDSMQKEVRAQSSDTNIFFVFYCTNVTDQEVLINYTQTSCGCTVASLPSYPYRIAGKGTGKIDVNMDVRGKYGLVSKTVTVNTSFGPQYLSVGARVPDLVAQAAGMNPAAQQMAKIQRDANQNLAKTDRQAVFKGSCSPCHAETARNKTGRDLFKAICAVCHDVPNRASMVPDLRNPKRPTEREYWTQWIMFGKAGSLMPAFCKAHGGPLEDDQIFSLVEYMVNQYYSDPPAATAHGTH